MRSFITYLLLAPIAPFLGWGPVTHIYLHKKAVDEMTGSGPGGILESEGDKSLFIAAGNIADLIKANQLRFKERYYEYTHNTIPTKFEGRPVFGERLYRENVGLGRRDGTIYSLGWICHQVSDQFPHRYPTNEFEGFVNSRRFFADFYPPDENDYSKPVKNLRNDLISADHWLVEILADMLCLSEIADYFKDYRIDLDFGGYPEIEALSARILDEYHDELYPAVKYFIPLKPEVLLRVYRYYHMVIRVFMDMYFHFHDSLGTDGIRKMLSNYPPLADMNRMLDYSIEAIHDTLNNPVGSWNPDKYKPPGAKPVKYSVYTYENYDGPERYDFGFRRGFIPWIAGLFSKSATLNEIGKRISDRVSTWPLIKPALRIASKRRRSGMNITAFIMCELDKSPNPDLAEIVAETKRRFKLKSRSI